MVAGKVTSSDLRFPLACLDGADAAALRLIWRNHLGGRFPDHLSHWLLVCILGYRLQAAVQGDLDAALVRRLRQAARPDHQPVFTVRPPAATGGRVLTPGTLLVRHWRGRPERVMVLEDGFAWNGRSWNSLSQVAKAMTGTSWNGHRFFGLQRKLQSAT